MKLEKISKKIISKKDIKMKMLVMYIIANLIYILIGSYIFFKGNLIENFQYKEFSIGLRYLSISNLIVFLVIFINKKKNKKLSDFKKPIYLGILLCAIFGIIATIFAVDKTMSLEGAEERYEGLYTILYYLTIMLLSTFVSDKYKKNVVKAILICGAIQAIYSICQCFSLFGVKQVLQPFRVYDENVKAEVYRNEIWAIGFTKNPNFFGSYMLLCLSYSLGLFMDNKKIWKKIVYAILSGIFMFCLLSSNAASCAVGLIIVFAYILIYCLKKKYYKKLITVFFILLSITCLTKIVGKTNLIEDMVVIGNEATQVAKGNLDNTYGTKRMYIWKETINIVPKHIWHGVGIDNFRKAFDGKPLIYRNGQKVVAYDKAHNEYLQILVTQGLFALASYLFIYGYVVHLGIKNSFKNNEIYLILPIIGYLVQGFFNISVIEVAPIFYIALGLCCRRKESDASEKVDQTKDKKMKICFLAPANNYHTKKWCEYFISKGYQVEVISFTEGNIEGANVHFIDCKVNTNDTDLKKIKYLFKCKKVKNIINKMQPDIINAHFATSYGMIAALTVPNNFICSVWGSDVYAFPKKSFIHKVYLKYLLKKAKCIFSTSKSMAKEINKYTNKKIYITPFGVKMDLFNPNKRIQINNEFTIGTLKPLEDKYGIDLIIKAVSMVNSKRPGINIKLKIAGQGSKEEEYKKLAIKEDVNVEWLGFITQENVAYELANMDAAIFLSKFESFGVAIIETQACGIPVIVSNVPGFNETTIPNKTSIMVERNNLEEIENAIIYLYDNPTKRKQMGTLGREYVLENYEYEKCFNNIEDLFLSFYKEKI